MDGYPGTGGHARVLVGSVVTATNRFLFIRTAGGGFDCATPGVLAGASGFGAVMVARFDHHPTQLGKIFATGGADVLAAITGFEASGVALTRACDHINAADSCTTAARGAGVITAIPVGV